MQRLFLRDQPCLCGLQIGQTGGKRASLAPSRVAFGQKAGHLRLETADPGRGGGQFALAHGNLPGQRGDQGGLLLTRGLCRRKIRAKPANIGLQLIGALAFQTQGIGKAGHLFAERVELMVLG